MSPAPRRNTSPVVYVAVVLVGLLAVAALAYLVLISPKRSEAARLDRDIEKVEAQIAEYRAAADPKAVAAVRAAELFKLAKAMPDEQAISGVILELNHVAEDSGIVFESITPQASEMRNGYQVLPISVVFEGHFYNLSDFLYRLRNLVHVTDGRLTTRGRLFSVSALTFSEAEDDGFPHISAELTVDAFVYGGAPAAVTTGSATETTTTPTTTTTTTSTTTTPTTTTPPAAGATGGPGS